MTSQDFLTGDGDHLLTVFCSWCVHHCRHPWGFLALALLLAFLMLLASSCYWHLLFVVFTSLLASLHVALFIPAAVGVYAVAGVLLWLVFYCGWCSAVAGVLLWLVFCWGWCSAVACDCCGWCSDVVGILSAPNVSSIIGALLMLASLLRVASLLFFFELMLFLMFMLLLWSLQLTVSLLLPATHTVTEPLLVLECHSNA